MVPVTSLVVPILVSAVTVFLASSVIHMVLPIHRHDWRRLPAEDGVLDAIRRFNIPPGDYLAPHAGSPEAMKNPEFIERMKKGPLLILTLAPGGPPSMGKNLLLWFIYCVIIGIIAAYLAGRALAPGAQYSEAFRFAGCTAFVGYALALPQNSIWYRRNWGSTIRSMVDGLIYGLLTGGAFGWLWPR